VLTTVLALAVFALVPKLVAFIDKPPRDSPRKTPEK